MRQIRSAFLALGLMLTATLAVRADDAADARALVDRALKAQGGETKLAKSPAFTANLKGTLHTMGQAIPFTGELASQAPDRQKFVMDAEIAGQKFRVVHIVNGNKGWLKLNDDTKELDKEELAEAREDVYSGWLSSLVSLRGKGITLATLGEIEVEKRPARGVRVSSKGHRDVNLYFDKDSGLLVKTETRVIDESKQEVTQESFLSDYKEVKGVKHSMKAVVKRDGKPFLETEMTEIQLAEKLDDIVFARP